MTQTGRDAAVWVVGCLAEIGLLFAWAQCFGVLPRLEDLQFSGVWLPVALMGGGILGSLLLNLWLIARRKFNWSREGLVSLIALFLLWAILAPVYQGEFLHALHARKDYRPSHRIME